MNSVFCKSCLSCGDCVIFLITERLTPSSYSFIIPIFKHDLDARRKKFQLIQNNHKLSNDAVTRKCRFKIHLETSNLRTFYRANHFSTKAAITGFVKNLVLRNSARKSRKTWRKCWFSTILWGHKWLYICKPKFPKVLRGLRTAVWGRRVKTFTSLKYACFLQFPKLWFL